jgi:hypothetical protein
MKHAIEGWVLAATVASGCGASLASPSARPDVLALEAPRRFGGGAGPAVEVSLAGVTEETFQTSPDDPERAGVAVELLLGGERLHALLDGTTREARLWQGALSVVVVAADPRKKTAEVVVEHWAGASAPPLQARLEPGRELALDATCGLTLERHFMPDPPPGKRAPLMMTLIWREGAARHREEVSVFLPPPASWALRGWAFTLDAVERGQWVEVRVQRLSRTRLRPSP